VAGLEKFIYKKSIINMATYAIGDVQGCFEQLQQLLKVLRYNPDKDTLWFVGDIVNRGPESLKTLRFIRALGDSAITVLGNHDLHLLAIANGAGKCKRKDTLNDILNAPDSDQLLTWLQHRPLLHYHEKLNVCMVHAGIHPAWCIEDALNYAHEVEQVLQSDKSLAFFQNMYGDEPAIWSAQISGIDRLRFITNVFTRMRYLNKTTQALALHEKGPPGYHASNLIPWFDFTNRRTSDNKVIFGHWSTLSNPQLKNIYPLDTGCLWGGKLTALEISEKMNKFVHLDCPKSQDIASY
jgi:bis(5'-nucleosyl)-tetraphosphatase (symmetrical)